MHMFSKITIPPRPRVKIGNVEGRLIIAEQYRQHGALWNIIVNGIKRNPEFSSYHISTRIICIKHGRH